MKHLKLFKTQAEFDAATLELPNVNYIVENDTVTFHPYVIDYKSQYLTFEAIEDSTFKLTKNKCQYSLNNGKTWISLYAGNNTPTVSSGNKIIFKVTNPSISSSYGIGTFSSTGKFNVSGNIMSMLYGNDFVDKNDLTGKNYTFYKLFSGCTNVVEAHNLILPATTLAERCYKQMFYGCTSLTTAPELPATTLVSDCYYEMFNGCSSLTTAPQLPATTLTEYCYSNMFKGCISLTIAPELPATTLYHLCYTSMFKGCTSLVTAPELPATTLSLACYSNMFYGCTSLTTAPELPATTLATSCYSYMFNGCSSLTTAPELPATILTEYCYSNMFKGCTSLTTAPELSATTLVEGCYELMFYGCSNLNKITMLATDTAYNCLKYWVSNVASNGTFVKHPNMTTLPTGGSGIPEGWTVEDYQE